MKPNEPSVKCNREIFMQTSERIFQPSCQPVSMTLRQISSIKQPQSVFMQRYRQNQCHLMSFQIKKKNKSGQVNNAF